MDNKTPKIFISYAGEDRFFVQQIEAGLKSAGAEVWIDYSDVRGGDVFPKRVSDALEWCDTFILIWTKTARDSRWVEREWTSAMNLNKDLIPCIFDKTELPGILSNTAYVDFQDSTQGLTKLLNGLELGHGDEHSDEIKPKRISLLIAITMSVTLLISVLLWQYYKSQPTTKTLILVANFEGPEPQKYRVTEIILDQLRDAIGKYQEIKVQALGKAIPAIHGNDLAEEIGKQKKARIVLWGWYAKSAEKALINVHFKVLEKPKYLPSIREKQTLNILVTEFENFEIQIQLSKEMSYFTLLTLGLIRYESGDYRTAISLFTEALVQSKLTRQSINPAITYFRRGITYLSNGEIDSAIVDFSHAIALKHDYGYAHINRGIAYLRNCLFHEKRS